MTAMLASRIRWYSLSVRVWIGATVIESPVWTPIGSTFSIEQMMTALSFLSRITSISNSFHPITDCSINTSVTGEAPPPQRKRRPNNQRQPKLPHRLLRVAHIGYDARPRHLQPKLNHQVFETLPV